MSRLSGTAVITGAGSGIGRALTDLASERGFDLALFDINGEELEESAGVARGRGVKVTTRVVDVADEGAVRQGAEEIAQEHGTVSLLINNAGVALGGYFEDYSSEDFRWLMEINFFGVVNMTRAFMPLLQKHRPHAHIVNISSIFGVIAPMGQTAYSASKFAVRGFSEALRHELEDSHIGVTVVHPGGVSTNIAKRAKITAVLSEEELKEAQERARKALKMPPPRAAQLLLDAAERGDKRLIVGSDGRMLAAIQRAFPVSYWEIMKRMPGLAPASRKPGDMMKDQAAE
ncbi:MAG: SDR family oxidoreductase [Parvularcula sp.]|jgi:short-subunit dehydrogenase|nr:SDR family oxidoreductase [Parvularcula sp.]